MSNVISNNRRIAVNTIILYIRMVVVMLISLFTSRIVLAALGFEDYGLYNVIGGVVGLFAFFRTSMEKATQRFLNFEMAKSNGEENKVFCVSLTIHVIIACVIFVIAETVGLFFLNSYINVPVGREFAAVMVYHTVIVSLCLTVIVVPFSACVIAHENMKIFAAVSIVDAIFKLVIAYLIVDAKDRLVSYGYLMMFVSVANLFFYLFYCNIKYRETRFRFVFEKIYYKDIFVYVGWTMLGQSAIVGTNQGNNILLNIFHGVTANTSMNIGSQVNAAIANLSSSFQTAFNPQITKLYASEEYTRLRSLVYSTSKLSFFLLSFVAIPVIYNINFILDFWLGKYPQESGIFCSLFIINGILNALSAPLNYSIMASGKIKHFQIATSIVYLSDLLLLYLLFKSGFPPPTVLWVKVFIMVVVLIVRLYYAHVEINIITPMSYLKKVIVPISTVTLLTVALCYIMSLFCETLIEHAISTFVIVTVFLITTLLIGIGDQERRAITKILRNVF